jgi:uncharacterized protein DUF3592
MTLPSDSQSEPSRDDPRVLGALYGVITFIVLIGAVALARRDVLPFINYQPVAAVVDSTSIEVRAGQSGDGYVPRVYFTYAVNGQTYHGTRVTPRDLRGKRRWAEHVVTDYQPHTQVISYYDPLQPDRAFLSRSASGFWGMIGLFGVWVAFATALLVRAIRKRRLTSA